MTLQLSFLIVLWLYINVVYGGRIKPDLARVAAVQNSWQEGVRKITTQLHRYQRNDIPISKRNLILFNVGEVNQAKGDSADVGYNNVQVFVSALLQHSAQAQQHAIYIFSVSNGQYNPLIRYVPSYLPNVVLVEWPPDSGEKETPIRTALMLGEEITSNFSAIIVSSDRVRGPMAKRKNGEWIESFRFLQDNNNVGAVGASFICQPRPKMQPHMYSFRPELISQTVANVLQDGRSKDMSVGTLIKEFNGGLDVVASRLKYNVASILQFSKLQQPFFDGTCPKHDNTAKRPTANPISWCDVSAEEVLFYKWGGVPLRKYGFICEETIEMVTDRLYYIQSEIPNLKFKIPETLQGSMIYELRREYNLEMWRDRYQPSKGTAMVVNGQSVATNGSTTSTPPIPVSAAVELPHAQSSHVCFVALTNRKHEAAASSSLFTRPNIEHFIKSLRRQANNNWRAYVVSSDDDVSHEDRIRNKLNKFEDNRIQYLGRHTLSKVQGERQRAIDALLSLVLNRPECTWVSLTSTDNLYGSDVVGNVLKVTQMHDVDGTSQPALVLNPIDSIVTGEQDYLYRDALRKMDTFVQERCVGVDSMIKLNLLPFTTQPNPVMGRLDISAAFFHRQSLIADKIMFANMTLPVDISKGGSSGCVGCQDGYLVEHLVHNRLWGYKRLPIDGLHSIIFHAPSPTLCVASGGVWFDDSDIERSGCISLKTLNELQPRDVSGNPNLDWQHYNSGPWKTCIRLTRSGHQNKQSILFNK